MKPAIEKFRAAIAKDKAAFAALQHGNVDPVAWLVYYEAKQEAYEALCASVPQVKEIPADVFWRPIQTQPEMQWVPWLMTEVELIERKARVCRDCGAWVKFPVTVCDKCAAARKVVVKERKSQKRALKKRIRHEKRKQK